MLAHLENLYLSPLLKDLYGFHVLLLDRLDSHLLPCLLVCAQLNKPELPLAQSALNVVKIKEVWIAYGLLEYVSPRNLVVLVNEIQDPAFIGWEHNLHRVQLQRLRLTEFFRQLLDKCIAQAVHDSVLVIIFVSVAVDFIAHEHGPVRFVSIILGLEITFALVEYVFNFVVVSEAFDHFTVV